MGFCSLIPTITPIVIQWDVFDVFHDGIDHVMINPMVIYWQILDVSLFCLYQRHY
jgi:hypothetical protein